MYIKQTNSTNTLLREMLPQEEFFTVWTSFQTAGRGQAGNGWESEEGKNLTFSVLLCPSDLEPEQQFRLSMMVPLAVVRVLRRDFDIAATVKWPNDIYVGDKKLSGILIENLLGAERYAIVGIGLNVNQRVFVSNAPNPTSMALEKHRDFSLEPLLESIVSEMRRMRPLLMQPDVLKQEYMGCLYRRDGFYSYVEREVSLAPTMPVQGQVAEAFEARIIDIAEDGSLMLLDREGKTRKYHFKQIRYVL